MKDLKIIFVVLMSLISLSDINSQSRPTLHITGGLAFPGKEFGGDLVTVSDSGITNISSEFIESNYGTSTGATITGALTFPLINSGIISGVLIGSYTFFNAFRRSILGTTIENNIEVPVSFDNRFSTSTFAFGLEAAPVSGSKISPYINANLSLNILSLSLSRNDFTSVIFNDAFRMGLLTNAGINFRIDQEYSVILSGSYHMSNLFFRSQSDSYADRIEFYRKAYR
ncbi:MAG: hypothetical protein IPL53_07685 [Ignavibacteria bacterium]|nr:hypothetical protein [Ignavibacteria bacterium]